MNYEKLFSSAITFYAHGFTLVKTTWIIFRLVSSSNIHFF